MFGWILLATATCTTLALGVPTAHAAVVRSGCAFVATDARGDRYFVGAAVGFALLDDQGTHSMRCYVTVNGAEQASTPTGSGTLAVVTPGTVAYYAPRTAIVELCTEVDGMDVGCARAAEVSTTLSQGSLVRTICETLDAHGVHACSLPVGVPGTTQYAAAL